VSATTRIEIAGGALLVHRDELASIYRSLAYGLKRLAQLAALDDDDDERRDGYTPRRARLLKKKRARRGR
jgi:hypothetical protein